MEDERKEIERRGKVGRMIWQRKATWRWAENRVLLLL